MKHPTTWILLAVALAASGCSDSTGGGGNRSPGDLTVLRLASAAPALCADSVGAYFKKDPNGQDQEIALVFPEPGSSCAGNTEDFLRLKLKPLSLQRWPDSALIANGDSVFISVKWVGSDSILFDLHPSGLIFDPANPAELRLEYGEAGDDLNHDNAVNAEDSTIEHELDIWRQEKPGDPYVRVGTGKAEDTNEIEAKLNGFSRYAIAY